MRTRGRLGSLQSSLLAVILAFIALPAAAGGSTCIELQYGGPTAGTAVITVRDEGVSVEDLDSSVSVEVLASAVIVDSESGLSFSEVGPDVFQASIFFTDGTARDFGNGVLDVRCSDDTVQASYSGGFLTSASVPLACDGIDVVDCDGGQLSGAESGCWTEVTTSTPQGCTDCDPTEGRCGGSISTGEGVLLHSGEFQYQAVDLKLPGRGLDFVWARNYRSQLLGPSTMGYGWSHSYDIKVYEILVPTPGEALNLRAPDLDNWNWDPPIDSGGDPFALRYCMLRSTDPADFTTPAKLQWVDQLFGVTTTIDTDVPPPNSGYYYLVAAENGGRQGTWGFDSDSIERQAVNCAAGEGPDLSLFDGSAGRYTRYLLQPGGVWHAPEFFREFRQELDGSYVLDFPDTGAWHFYPPSAGPHGGQISRIVDRNGNEISFQYSLIDGSLERIVDTLGREIDVFYNGLGLIERVGFPSDYGVVEAQYEYDERICTGFPSPSCATTPDCVGTCGPDGLCSNASVECTTSAECDFGSCVDTTGFKSLVASSSPAIVGTPTGNDFPGGKTERYYYAYGTSDELLRHNLTAITHPSGERQATITYSAESTPGAPGYDTVVSHRRDRYIDEIIDWVYLAEAPVAANGFAVQRTIVNDSVGNVNEHYIDSRGRVVLRREWTGRALQNQPTTETGNRPANALRSDDPPFFDTTWTYNQDGMVIGVVHPRGNSETYTYDSTARRSRGNLVQECKNPGSLPGGMPPICQSYEYDPLTNKLTRYEDGRGNEAIHEYDGAGNRTLTRDRIPSVVHEWTHDAWGRPTSHRWPDNGSGQRRYDVSTYYGLCDSGPAIGESCLTSADCAGLPCNTGEGHFLHEQVVGAFDPDQPANPVLDLTTTYEYDSNGHVVRVTDPRGNVTDYLRNSLGQLLRMISPETETGSGIRYTTDYYYDANNNRVRADVENLDEDGVLQPNTHFTTIYEYDSLNRLVRECSEVGTYTGPIDPVLPACPTSTEFVTTEYEYDSRDNRTLIRYPEAVNGNQPARTVRLIYDERDLLFQEIRAEGHADQSTTQYDYDDNGNLRRTRSGLEAVVPHDTFYDYDVYDRLSLTTDALLNRTFYTYDDNGNRTREEVEGELEDDLGDLSNTLLSDASHVYDDMDRRTETTKFFFEPDPLGFPSFIGDGESTRTTTFSDNSQRLTVTDDNSQTTTYAYDSVNRLTSVDDPEGNRVDYVYDENDNVVTRTETEVAPPPDPAEVYTTTYTYDGLDRRIRMEDTIGNRTRSRYDSRGNLKSMEDALRNPGDSCGNFTLFDYDGLGRQLSIDYQETDPASCFPVDSIQVSKAWDDDSRLVGQTDGVGNTTNYTYDPLNRLTSRVYEDGTSYQTVYDVHDNVVTTTDARSVVVDYQYDGLDRLTQKTVQPNPGIGGTTYESFTYDGMSRMVRAENDDALVVRFHDSLSNISYEILNLDPPFNPVFDQLTECEHDGEGNQLTCTYPGGRVLDRTYDGLNRVLTIGDAGGPIADYTYRGVDRVEAIDFGNTTGASFSYDGLSNPANDYGVKRMVSSQHAGPGGPIEDRTYLWDSMQNKVQRKDLLLTGPQFTHDYSYELSLYRLIESVKTPAVGPTQGATFVLDGAHNRVSVGGDKDPGLYGLDPTTPEPADRQVNQYSTTSFDSRLYDTSGNLVTIDDANPPTRRDIVYDYRNRMVDFNGPGVFATYAYDALGRRIAKMANIGPPTMRYLYNGDRVVEEQSAPGVTTATYVYGRYIDEVLSMRNAGGADFYFHRDDRYSVMALTDSFGALVERYEYDDFGRPVDPATLAPIGGNPSLVGNPYLFTGRRYDAETGWYWYRTRYLDPRAGRFTTRDTIDMWGDAVNVGNANAYVGNNPATYLDPSGRAQEKGPYSNSFSNEEFAGIIDVTPVGDSKGDDEYDYTEWKPLDPNYRWLGCTDRCRRVWVGAWPKEDCVCKCKVTYHRIKLKKMTLEIVEIETKDEWNLAYDRCCSKPSFDDRDGIRAVNTSPLTAEEAGARSVVQALERTTRTCYCSQGAAVNVPDGVWSDELYTCESFRPWSCSCCEDQPDSATGDHSGEDAMD